MEHSPKYEKVKEYFNKGLWNEEMVRNAVVKGWITEEELLLIINETYEE